METALAPTPAPTRTSPYQHTHRCARCGTGVGLTASGAWSTYYPSHLATTCDGTRSHQVHVTVEVNGTTRTGTARPSNSSSEQVMFDVEPVPSGPNGTLTFDPCAFYLLLTAGS